MGKAMEFVIPARQSQEARRIKQHVVDLFQVKISFVSSPETVSRTGVEWIQIVGEQERLPLAKEYIISACTPEETEVVDVPDVLHELFIEDKVSPLPHIEKEYRSFIQYDPAQGICIRGKAVEVTLIVSYLEQEIPKWKDMEVAKKTSLPSQSQKLDFVQRDLRNYVRRLGYSDHQIDVAAFNCGPCLTENSLLQELLVLFGSNRSGESITLPSQIQVYDFENPYAKPEEGTTTKIVAKSSSAREEGAEETIGKLRHVVVDGSNVAMCHGNKEIFSCRGIQLCVDWFKNRGHSEITVIVPQWRKEESKTDNPILDREILLQLERERILVFTPSRRVNGKRVVCYDDRYIVKVAAEEDGIIVSNDHFRDLERESPEYKQVIDQRLLMYTFVNDRFMPPDDPLGRHGPSLDDFLKKGTPLHPKLCPYGRRCTYGQKCRYYHPKKEAELLKRDLEAKKSQVDADVCTETRHQQIDITSPRVEEAALKKIASPRSRPSSYSKVPESGPCNHVSHVLDSRRKETKVLSSQPIRSCASEELSQRPEYLRPGVDVVSRGQDAGPTQKESPVIHLRMMDKDECQLSPKHGLYQNSSKEEHHKCSNFTFEGYMNSYSQSMNKLGGPSQILHYDRCIEKEQRVELGTRGHQVNQSSVNRLHGTQDGHIVANDHRGMVSSNVNQPGVILMPLQQGCHSTQVYGGNVAHLPSVPSAVYPLNYDSFSYNHGQRWMAVPQPTPLFISGSPHSVPFTKRVDVNVVAASSAGYGTDILLELQQRFPGQNDKILQILRQYPQESDIHILSWLMQNSHTP